MQHQIITTKSYFAFLSLAFTTYLSFYCLMSSVNYWKEIYNSVFTTIVCSLYNFFEIFGTLFSMKIGVKYEVTTAVHFGLCANIFTLLIIPVFYFIKNFYVRYVITIIPILLGGFASGQYYCMLSSCGARINLKLSQSIQLGIGISEILIQVMKDIVSAFFEVQPSDPQYRNKLFYNTLVYYFFGIFILILQFPVWNYIRLNFKQFITPLKLANSQQQKVLVSQQQDLLQDDKYEDQQEVVAQQEQCKNQLNKKQLFKYLIPSISAQCLQYFISYFIFPALFTAVPCYKTQQLNNNWMNLLTLTLYFGFDCIGRLAPMFQYVNKVFKNINVVIILAYSRGVLIIIYFLMVLPRPQFSINKLPLIHNDVFSCIMAALLGVSGGFAGTLLFMKYQDQLKTQEERGSASLIMTIFYQLGITNGCFCGLFLAFIVKD